MIRTIRTLLLLSSASLLVFAPAALAGGNANYPPTTVEVTEFITLSDYTVAQGESVLVTSGIHADGAEVVISIESDPVEVARVRADSNGIASATVTVPFTVAPGQHDMVARCLDPDGNLLEVRARFTVLAAGAGDGDGTPLAKTGTDSSIPLARLGLGLLAAGSLMVLAVRRRSDDDVVVAG